MIKFEFENEKENMTFGMVGEDQFFICAHGYLCQKTSPISYAIIADDEGNPHSDKVSTDSSEVIKKVLPKVEKITF